MCSSPDSECEDQTDFKLKESREGVAVLVFILVSGGFVMLATGEEGIWTSEPYTNCSKELWKSSVRSAMRRMVTLRKE